MIEAKKIKCQVRTGIQEAAQVTVIRNGRIHVIYDDAGRRHAAFPQKLQSFSTFPAPRMYVHTNGQSGRDPVIRSRLQYLLLATHERVRSSNVTNQSWACPCCSYPVRKSLE